MALNLALQISTVEECGGIMIEDVTGFYNATSNPDGWGGGMTLSDLISATNLFLQIRVFNFMNDEYYDTPIVITMAPGIAGQSYTSADSWEGFQVLITADEIYLALVNAITSSGLTLPDELDESWTTIEDTVYEVSISAQDITSPPNGAIPWQVVGECFYGSTCNTEKCVNKLFSSIDVECEDCDDADLDKALLAKSLLENLKSMITCHL